MMIHYNDEAKVDEALDFLRNAYRLAPKRPTPPQLIVERVAQDFLGKLPNRNLQPPSNLRRGLFCISLLPVWR